MKIFPALPLLLLLFTACGDGTAADQDADTEEQAMASDGEEMQVDSDESGWIELFNGENFDGWHSYGREEVPAAWTVNDDGSFYLDVSGKKDPNDRPGGDLTTDEAYANYQLELEWKIAPCGNSGIIYNVTERDDLDHPYLSGPEMQILDNDCHPDAQYPDHRAGDLYDIKAVSEQTVRPAGEWNKVKLVVMDDGNVQHYQNGKLVVAYNNKSQAFRDMVADSKFADWEHFAKTSSGHISLQDHGDEVHFRNIRLRPLIN